MRQGETRRELALEAVASDGIALRYASAGLKDDRKVVLKAIKENADALVYASFELQDELEYTENTNRLGLKKQPNWAGNLTKSMFLS